MPEKKTIKQDGLGMKKVEQLIYIYIYIHTHAHTHMHTHTHTHTYIYTHIYIYIYIYIYKRPVLVGRVFANGLGDLGSIPGRVIPKT